MWMPTGADIPGGHQVQLASTAAALRLRGIDVVECRDNQPPVNIDVLHGFGLDAAEIHRFRRLGIPVAISPIYWDLDYRSSGPGRQMRLRDHLGRAYRSARFARASYRGRASLARESLAEVGIEIRLIAAYSSADMLLPNAKGEADALIADLGITSAIEVIPNGVDAARFEPGFKDERRARSVLCVGRIEPHKNQLGLIKELADLDIDLTIAGPVHPHHESYYRRCVDAANGAVHFTGWIADIDLPGTYRRAEVHVLPTWFETTGLASLEAALSGCKVVTTSRGYANEYFGDEAWYCDPGRPASIRSAVLAALGSPVPPRLADRIRSTYTWDHAADATLAAYEALLGRRT